MKARLTSKRCNGIKEGYWSTAKKDDLCQRLGAYEDTGLEPQEIQRPLAWRSAKDELPIDLDDDYVVFIAGAKVPTVAEFDGEDFQALPHYDEIEAEFGGPVLYWIPASEIHPPKEA